MGMMANIICKGVGIAGMSAVLYDAYSVGHHHSKVMSEEVNADLFEKIHADSRTTSTESHVTGAMQKKIAKLRMNNPFVSVFGNVKGFVSGFLDSLGDNILPAALASIALAGKGKFAKFGAWSTAAYALFVVLKEGFGVSKKSPME